MDIFLGQTEKEFCGFFFSFVHTLSHDRRKLFVMMLWNIWRRRNLKLWDDIIEDHSQVIARTYHVLQEWSFANKSSQQIFSSASPLHCFTCFFIQTTSFLDQMQCWCSNFWGVGTDRLWALLAEWCRCVLESKIRLVCSIFAASWRWSLSSFTSYLLGDGIEFDMVIF